ncbi:hypothetical protein DVA43_02460 [Leclercia sp. W6]|nr:hypothetical protein DVA43_02460 [Leclercia sp. W6]
MINRYTIGAAAALFAVATFTPEPAHAISASYRAQLEKSGCTQVTDSNGTCDIHKTKAQNTGGALPDVIGGNTEDAFSALSAAGWNSSEPLTFDKGNHRLILTVRGDTVINAEQIK